MTVRTMLFEIFQDCSSASYELKIRKLMKLYRNCKTWKAKYDFYAIASQ